MKKLTNAEKAKFKPYENKIAELEKENAELKAALKGKRCSCMTYLNFKDLEKQLTKAKEIIKNLLILKNDHYGNTKMEWRVKVTEQAEQFLNSEVEK